MSKTSPGWIGAAPTRVQAAAAMAAGVCGVMIAGLQPLLLGGLAAEGRLSTSEIGQAATAELLAMGLAAGLAGAWLRPHRLPLIAAAAALVLAAIDLATMKAADGTLIALRGVAGVPSGILVWVTIALIARSPTPERWAGIFLTLQTAGQGLWAAGLTAAGADADTGFASLAVLCGVSAVVSLALPPAYAPLAKGVEETGIPPPRGWLALGSCFLFLAFTISVWVYAEPLSRQAGHGPDVIGTAVSVSLASQVVGGLAATLTAGRVGWFGAVMGSGLLFSGVLAVLWQLPGAAIFLILQAIFGFLWLFTLPFIVPMAIEADPSRRAAVLIGGAQLIGGGLGPSMAAQLVSESDARGVLVFGAVCLAGALAIASILHVSRRRSSDQIGSARSS